MIEKRILDEIDISVTDILYHIDKMYPQIWKNVPKSAKVSLRNTMKQEIRKLIENLYGGGK